MIDINRWNKFIKEYKERQVKQEESEVVKSYSFEIKEEENIENKTKEYKIKKNKNNKEAQ